MPYLDATPRSEMASDSTGRGPRTAGELTYKLTEQIIDFMYHKRADEGIHYQCLAEVLGALEGAKLDFMVRILEPYEARAISRNGDVWPDAILDTVHR